VVNATTITAQVIPPSPDEAARTEVRSSAVPVPAPVPAPVPVPNQPETGASQIP